MFETSKFKGGVNFEGKAINSPGLNATGVIFYSMFLLKTKFLIVDFSLEKTRQK